MSFKKRYIAIGVILSLIVISRLDDIFLPAMMGFVVFFTPSHTRLDTRGTLSILLPTGIVIILYLFFNYFATGYPLPVSFLMKSGPAIGENLRLLVQVALDTFGIAFHDTTGIYQKYGISWRLTQTIFPAIVCVVSLFIARKCSAQVYKYSRLNSSQCMYLKGMMLYVIIKSVYVFAFTPIWMVGDWYFPVSILFTNFICCLGVHIFISRFLPSSRRFKWEFAYSVLYIVVWFSILMPLVINPLSRDNEYHKFWSNRYKYQAALNHLEVVKAVELDDGIINYSTNISMISGFGYASDYELYQAIKVDKIFDYLWKRGYNVIASYHYTRGRLNVNPSEDEIKEWIELITKIPLGVTQDIQYYKFSEIYRSSEGLVLIQFVPIPTISP